MFSINYSHVKAHQDNTTSFKKLSRSSQLNCICNHLAKQRLSDGEPEPKVGAALENFLSKKSFQTVFFVSAML
jgi:hypothetical protein